MVTWFTSQKGAIALSVIGLLSFIAYAFLVSRYILENLTPGVGAAFIETLIVLAIVGGWVWGLLTALEGNRSGLIVILICSLLPSLFTIYDLVLYSPIKDGWPLLQIVVWITFITNVVAVVAVALRLKNTSG
jgi:hypothetical protein